MTIGLHMFERMSKCTPSYFVMAHMITKFTELIQNEVAWVFVHFVARVVNLFNVAFGTGRTNNVRRVAHPFIEPIKTLLRHARRKHSHTA